MNRDYQTLYDSVHHPGDEQLNDYLGGRLEKTAHESIQAHLVECDDCLAAFRDVRDFFESRRDGEPIINEDIAQEWQSFWTRIQADDEKPEVLPERRPSRFRLNPAWAFVLSAILLVAIGIWAIVVRRENRQLAEQLESLQQRTAQLEIEQQNLVARAKDLEQKNLNLEERALAVEPSRPLPPADRKRPELNAPVYELYSRAFVQRSGNEGEMNRIKVPPSARSMTLILNGEGISVYPSYGVEILDAKGQAVWRGSGLKQGSYGNFTITLDTAFLGKGAFRLKLNGPTAQELTEYLLRIE
jgi:hypothetical protein